MAHPIHVCTASASSACRSSSSLSRRDDDVISLARIGYTETDRQLMIPMCRFRPVDTGGKGRGSFPGPRDIWMAPPSLKNNKNSNKVPLFDRKTDRSTILTELNY